MLFFILGSISYFTISFIEKNNIESTLERTSVTYTKAFNTIYSQYKELSEVIFTGLTNLASVENRLIKFHNSSKEEQDNIRKVLYKDLLKRYKALKKKKLKNINITLPNNTMLLKMNKAQDFGHKITYRRETIFYANDTLKAVDSYEIGAYGSGFRFVYPYIIDGKFYGSMDITFGAEAITSGIMKQYSVLSNFYINQNKFEDEFINKKQNKVKKSHHAGYLYDLAVLRELKKVTSKDISNLKPNKTTTDQLLINGTSKEPLSLYNSKLNSIYTTIPIIHKLTKEQEAFLTIRSNATNLQTLSRNYKIISVLVIFLIGAVLLVIYQQIVKGILEEDKIAKNIEKDKQLLEQAKMAQMGEMIGNIAHQWRQPLSTITTAASGVKINHEYNILKEEELPEFMDTIIKNAEYLSQTIDNFRDFIKEKHDLKVMDIEDKIERTLDIISSSLTNNHVKVINNIHFDEPIKIKMVQGVLSQILMNILNNSKDILVEKNIENRWVKLELENYNDKIIITIEDNGGGISDEVMPKIFDPYFTTKHQAQGTGLGLYMSREIAQKHLHGDIKVENTQNGAKFFITIPKKEDKELDELS